MISCAVTTSFLGCLVTFSLFFRYVFFMPVPVWAKSTAALCALLAGCFPLLVGYGFEKYLGGAFAVYRYALYFIYVTCIILFALTILSDAAVFAAVKAGLVAATGEKARLYYSAGLIAAALLCGVYALYDGMKVPAVKTVTIASDKIRKERTIVLLGDVHIHRVISAAKVRGIVEKTNAQKPDLILLSGDIIDDEPQKIADVARLLEDLKARDGVYFVTGNHEFYIGYRRAVDMLTGAGFHLLENDGADFSDLFVAGVPDVTAQAFSGKKADARKAFSKAKDGQFRLLISHTPTDFKDGAAYDLQVAGHTHGGQIFPFHILTKLYNPYLSGLYEKGSMRVYVTNGAGQWGPQMRFLAEPEITVIRLIPETAK